MEGLSHKSTLIRCCACFNVVHRGCLGRSTVDVHGRMIRMKMDLFQLCRQTALELRQKTQIQRSYLRPGEVLSTFHTYVCRRSCSPPFLEVAGPRLVWTHSQAASITAPRCRDRRHAEAHANPHSHAAARLLIMHSLALSEPQGITSTNPRLGGS
ncbi:hypothetical protein M011DRAFT_301450 [Sporormia fimetaria CBS 119925]|uniref:Uncharacterized protein n=1 Tax=Sporormia fimetaria CBS 119925 TaxID=1340428 RepID=A0A6A6UUG9_9PLEO|nr:hypothetical protein M011DRAFT_301450 [Sporormia fimetaria CBS 119925]